MDEIMSSKKNILTAVMAAAALTLSMDRVYSDEGMWLYDDPPLEILKAKYNYSPSAEWLEHLQKASVRFNNGGSGSFVSADGLVISNHHVGAGALEKLSTEENNIFANGFYARTPAEELRCHDLELNVLMSIEDVTDQVNAVIRPGMSSEEAFKARREIMAKIEAESLEKTGLRSDVVTLFQGGKYSLYRYKRYTDVRLVFAPESLIASFGGDTDNFEYPRYDLDISIFRVYENDKPVKIDHYLTWNMKGVAENDLIFMSGNPGSTSRLITMAELKSDRDLVLPYTLQRLNRLEVLYSVWAARSKENSRRAKQSILGIQNARKAFGGHFTGLLDPSLIAKKEAEEKALKEAIAASSEYKDTLKAFDQIAQIEKDAAESYLPYRIWEGAQAFNSSYFGFARTLLRNADEKSKPSGERLREFRDSNKVSLELRLFSEAPIYEDFEILRLTDSLKFAIEQLGYNDPLVQRVLAGKSPEARAFELVKETQIKTAERRKAIYAMSPVEIQKLNDPMIEVARVVDGAARQLRKVGEQQAELTKQAHDKIAKARFALMKEHSYPDATFTLRLSYGQVKGYEEAGQAIPFQTDLKGMYAHAEDHDYEGDFDLPESWKKPLMALDLNTPCNFVSTADIIGGNSGSPVVNRAGEFVGIVFDGNIQSLVGEYVYTDVQARSTSINCQFIIEALNKVYGAEDLAKEILNGRR